MVEISLSGSGEGSGWVTAPGYSTAAFSAPPIVGVLTSRPEGARSGPSVAPHRSVPLVVRLVRDRHGRREILHFGVTAHPTSPWVVQQLRDAFPEESAPRFLIYDNNSIFSERVTESIKNVGIEPQRTAFRS